MRNIKTTKDFKDFYDLHDWGMDNPYLFLKLYVEYLKEFNSSCEKYYIFTDYQSFEDFVGVDNVLKILKTTNDLVPQNTEYIFGFNRKFYLLGAEYKDGELNVETCEVYAINKPARSRYFFRLDKEGKKKDFEDFLYFCQEKNINLSTL